MDYAQMQKDEDNDSGVEEDKELILLGSITATESNKKSKKKKKEKVIDDEKRKKLDEEEVSYTFQILSKRVILRTKIKSFKNCHKIVR